MYYTLFFTAVNIEDFYDFLIFKILFENSWSSFRDQNGFSGYYSSKDIDVSLTQGFTLRFVVIPFVELMSF